MKKNMKNNIKRAKLLGVCLLMSCLAAGCAGTADGENVGESAESMGENMGAGIAGSIDSLQEEQVIGPCSETGEVLSGYAGAQAFSKALFLKGFAGTNPVESPVSAYLAMALAGQGAKGETAAEFDAVMGVDREAMSQAFMKSFPSETEGTKVALANSAWIDRSLICEEEWLTAARQNYLAQVNQTELSTVKTMGEINAWIEQNTQGLIKDFLDGPLQEQTKLTLFNTVYFKGQWQSAFSAESTGKEPFTLADGSQVQVDMMRKTANMYYLQQPDGQAGAEKAGAGNAGTNAGTGNSDKKSAYEGVALPYRDSELLYVALMPAGGQSVRELYESLELSALGDQMDAVKKAQNPRVNLWLPKYKVTFDRILNSDMMEMGLTKAFDPEHADFTGIGTAPEGDLYISLVRQKAVFIVDEEGTEAAAVTEVTMRTNSMMPVEEPPIEVHFDKPFLYMIFDPETDMPLFVGIMDDPGTIQN